MAANDFQIVTATHEHCERLAPRMREADKAEIWASGHSTPLQALVVSLELSREAYTAITRDGRVAWMWGVAPWHAEGVGVAWLLGSSLVEEMRVSFCRLCRAEAQRLLKRWRVLLNLIDNRHQMALRWAYWLGATVGPPVPFGPEGRPFRWVELTAETSRKEAPSV